jgi:hypothetical protein
MYLVAYKEWSENKYIFLASCFFDSLGVKNAFGSSYIPKFTCRETPNVTWEDAKQFMNNSCYQKKNEQECHFICFHS